MILMLKNELCQISCQNSDYTSVLGAYCRQTQNPAIGTETSDLIGIGATKQGSRQTQNPAIGTETLLHRLLLLLIFRRQTQNPAIGTETKSIDDIQEAKKMSVEIEKRRVKGSTRTIIYLEE